VIPSTGPDPGSEDACRMAAAQLQHDHSHWLIMWGCYTRSYIAFPLFAAPRGTILTAAHPADLAAKMRRQERSARVSVPPPSPSPDTQEAADWQGQEWQAQDWQGAQDRPGRHSLHRTR
jgi:hypothetical protein